MAALSVEERELRLWHVLGPRVPGLVAAAGLPLPEVMAAIVTDSGFIARTGEDEFLVHAGESPLTDQALCWSYARADRVVALRGDAWREAMAQVCHLDFARFGQGDWLMAAAAGINIWCLGLADGLLLGCDPSLGAYLQDTLNDIVHDINETLSTDEGEQP